MTRHTTALRALFAALLAFTLYMAWTPKPPHLSIDRFGDKFEHMLAFVVLSAMASLAFPRARLPRIAERLSFLGALIEVVQNIPALHRDCDIMDWIADTGAIIVTLLIVAGVRRYWSSRSE
jgi:hypothetical protein